MSIAPNYDTLVAKRHQYLQSLIATQRPIIGYIYPHAPLELFFAHQLIPTLLWAEPKVPGAYEASLQTFCCAYSRNLFSQRAKKRLPNLTAITFPGGTCDSLQNLGDIWQARFPEDTVLRLTYPVRHDEAALTYFIEELQNFSKYIEVKLGRNFSIKKYNEAVALLAEFRAAAQFITAARILKPECFPYIAYTKIIRQFLTAPGPNSLQLIEQAVSLVQDALRNEQLIPSVEALRYGLLQNSLADLSIPLSNQGPRILVVGGMVDPEGVAVFFENAKTSADLESAEIVLDLLSFTYRTLFVSSPSLQGNPFHEQAESILSAPTEPTQEGLSNRLRFLKDVITRFKIDGVIICEQSFCDPDQFEVPDMLKLAEKAKVLTVRLPLDPEFSDRARIEGRLQSFLETLSVR